MSDLRKINNLKLRVSLGMLGNQNIGDYLYSALVSRGGENNNYVFDGNLYTGATYTSISNPNLTWEKSKQLDVAVDYGFFGNRIAGTVEYYFNHTTGQIKVWHDNVLIRSNSVSMGSQKWLPFYLTSNYADSHDATNYVYFDNIEIYSDAGTGATGLMSDGTISNTSSSTSSSGTTTLPPAPTNLVVVQ